MQIQVCSSFGYFVYISFLHRMVKCPSVWYDNCLFTTIRIIWFSRGFQLVTIQQLSTTAQNCYPSMGLSGINPPAGRLLIFW